MLIRVTKAGILREGRIYMYNSTRTVGKARLQKKMRQIFAEKS